MIQDPGMSRPEAEALADRVRCEHLLGVTVEPDGEHFTVEVNTKTSRWTLYDEADWGSWRLRILGEG